MKEVNEVGRGGGVSCSMFEIQDLIPSQVSRMCTQEMRHISDEKVDLLFTLAMKCKGRTR
jgi:hypothetical protein